MEDIKSYNGFRFCRECQNFLVPIEG